MALKGNGSAMVEVGRGGKKKARNGAGETEDERMDMYNDGGLEQRD